MKLVTKTITIKRMNKKDEKIVNEALHDVWGVRNVKLNPETGEAIISYDEDAASFIDFKQAILDTGFEINEQNNEEL
jgi:copper chaperone CopZ